MEKTIGATRATGVHGATMREQASSELGLATPYRVYMMGRTYRKRTVYVDFVGSRGYVCPWAVATAAAAAASGRQRRDRVAGCSARALRKTVGWW